MLLSIVDQLSIPKSFKLQSSTKTKIQRISKYSIPNQNFNTSKLSCISSESDFQQGYDFDTYDISKVDFATGFPVPIPTRQINSPKTKSKKNLTLKKEKVDLDDDIKPVFRISPYDAENKKKKNTKAQILFLEEGNVSRAIFSEAILKEMLEASGLMRDIIIKSASIGPIFNSGHDNRVKEAAKLSDIKLPSFKKTVFDSVNDIVNYDLVIVMDRYDYEEIYREISVMDNINPIGYYCSKLKMLGSFSLIDSAVANEPDLLEIQDPFYGTVGDPKEKETLNVIIRQIRNSCKYLIRYFLMLKSRCSHEMTLKTALIQSLRCPLMENSSKSRAEKVSKWHPIWLNVDSKSKKKFYTIKSVSNGSYKIVRKYMNKRKPHQYWKNIHNVDREIRNYMEKHNYKDKLPPQSILRKNGLYTLSSAITYHGGIKRFEQRFHVTIKRRSKSYWSNKENVKKELKKWLDEHGTSFGIQNGEKMPSRKMLRSTGNNALASALSRHGGIDILGKEFGLKIKHHGSGYWLRNFKNEIEPYLVPDLDGNIYFPTQRELIEAKRFDLMGYIQRSGGTIKLAEELGVMHRKSHARYHNNLIVKIKNTCKELNCNDNEWPSLETLKQNEKYNLLNEIKNYDKYKKLAFIAGAEIKKHKGFLDGALDELFL